MTTDAGGIDTTSPHSSPSDLAALDELRVRDLLDRLASGDPTPGGGSASALAGALAAGLAAMVLRLTDGRTSDDDAMLVRESLVTATSWTSELLNLATLDASAYDAVIRARRLPKATDAERASRRVQVEQANRLATDVPLRTARAGMSVLELIEPLVAVGNPHAISDLGVAAHLAASCVHGGLLNVRINLPSLPADDPLREDIGLELDELGARAADAQARIAAAVRARMNQPAAGGSSTPT